MVRMISAGEIEGIVFDQLKIMYKNPLFMANASAKQVNDNLTIDEIRQACWGFEGVWR